MVTLYFKYTGPDLTSTLMLRCGLGIIFTNMQTTIVYWFVDTSCKCAYLFQELYYRREILLHNCSMGVLSKHHFSAIAVFQNQFFCSCT